MRVVTEEGGGALVAEPSWVLPARDKVAAPVRDPSKRRIKLAILAFMMVYGVIAWRLVDLGMTEPAAPNGFVGAAAGITAARPDLVDRNGEILATDIKTASLYAEPRLIADPHEAAVRINSVLPDLTVPWLEQRMTGNGGFIWLKRELTPRQQDAIHLLGIPGIGFLTENKRFYPGGNVVSHIVGFATVENVGVNGIEAYIDAHGLTDLRDTGFAVGNDVSFNEPVRLSVDVRVQHILRDELAYAMERHRANFAVGIILDIYTGEVIAMASLPDYDPNVPAQGLDGNLFDRATQGVYELGSVFKTLTIAMALDSGRVRITDVFDASQPFRSAGFTINDYHGQNRPLTVPEVFIYSSNIGASRMAVQVGAEEMQDFLTRMGLTSRVPTELPGRALPLVPSRWPDITLATVSFGHGISVTPMHLATAAAALVNGGHLIPPTFFPRDRETALSLSTQVVSEQTSQAMRYMFRLNGTNGSGRRADSPDYLVGGKTGTAEKVIDGRYSSTAVLNSYLAAFPMDDPRYIVLTVLDDPKPAAPTEGTTAAYNAAPVVSNVIRRAAPLLGVSPRFDGFDGSLVANF